MSNAAHVRAMGWDVGTILDGAPVRDDAGTLVERGKQRVITAIGQSVVVVRDRTVPDEGSVAEYGHWGSEVFGGFDARSWTKTPLCGQCATCIGVVMSTKPYPESLEWPFIVCVECGNKRCPRAEDHAATCTHSNAPGQPGTRYPGVAQLGPWRDRDGDIWTLADDGLMHTPETAPFPPEHVARKWGPLVPVHKSPNET